jgi:hypothetical protein
VTDMPIVNARRVRIDSLMVFAIVTHVGELYFAFWLLGQGGLEVGSECTMRETFAVKKSGWSWYSPATSAGC